MENTKENKTEYLNEEHQEESTYNRKNVNNIKKFIIVMILVLCIVPILLCFYLLAKMNAMEKEIKELNEKFAAKQQINIYTDDDYVYETSDEDLLILEQQAATDINREEEDNESLSMSEEEVGISPNVTTEQQDSLDRINNDKKVYLTFDDGPSKYTDQILDVLREKNVKATFFVVYNENQELWDEYSRIAQEGHTLAMHSYTHVYSEIYASKEAFIEDITMIHDFLYEQTGVDCTYYRFPGGSSNQVSSVDINELMAYLDENGYTYYDWNALSEDAVNASLTPEELNNNVMNYVRNNSGDSIVLLHDLENNPATAEGLAELIDTLIAEGYEICPIDENTVPVQHRTYNPEEE